MRQFLLILLVFVSSLAYNRHPVHFSVINMELKPDSMCFDYSIRVFQEDYLNLLGFIYHDDLHNNQGNNVILDTSLVDKYFQKSLVINVDGVKTNQKFIRQSFTETEAFFFYRIDLIEIPETLLIENNILLELFADQTNLLILSCNSNEKGLTFGAKTNKQLFSLKDIL